MTASIAIREGDKHRKVTKLEGIILQASIKALKGDNAAAQTILKYAAQAGLVNPTEAIRESPQLSVAEQAILDEVKTLLPASSTKRR